MDFSPYALSTFLTMPVALLTAAYAWQRRHSPGAVFLAVMLLGTAIGSSAYGLELMSSDLQARLWWAVFAYLGAALTAPAALLLVLWFSGRNEWLGRRRIIALFFPPLLIVSIVLSRPLYHWPDSAAWLNTSGLIYLLDFVCIYLYFVIAALLSLQALWRSAGIYRHQAAVVFVGMLLPLATQTAYLFGFRLFGFLNPIHYAYIVTGCLFAWGMFRYQLFRLTPVPRAMLFENLREGVLLLDARNQVVDLNRSARALLGLSGDPIGQPLQQATSIAPKLGAWCLSASEMPYELQTSETHPRWLEVRASVLLDRVGQPIGRQVILNDITTRKQAEMALQSLNARLEQRLQERTTELECMRQELALSLVDQTRKLAALFDMILIGGQSLSIPDLLDRSLQEVMGVLGGQAICLHETNEQTDTLQLLAQHGLEPQMCHNTARWPGDWLQGEDVPRTVLDLAAGVQSPAFTRLPGYCTYLGAPIHLQGQRVGVLSIWWADPYQIQIEDIAIFSTMADQIGIILENARLRQRIEHEATAQERRRLARDLHDSVTQSLHSLVLFTDTICYRLEQGQSDRWQTLLPQLSKAARQALREMRLLLYEMRPADQENLRLVEALQLRLGAVEQRAGLDARLEVQGMTNWPVEWESELYAVAIEALNNSLKHAYATCVDVRLHNLPDGVELHIIDNGCGYDAQRVAMGGMGLNSMAERTQQLGGTLTMNTAKGQGTHITLRVIKHPADDR